MKQSKFYQRPPNSKHTFGEDEKVWYICGVGETVVGLLKKKTIPQDAVIRIMTNNFREDKWGFGTDWYQFAEKKLKEGVKIKAYGWQDIEANDAIKSLMDLEMKVFKVDGALTKEGIKEHYVTVDNPRQIWAEAKHVGFYAYGCIYTDKPYEDTWDAVSKYFSDIENHGKWLASADL